MDPAGPTFYSINSLLDAPLDEKVDSTDAVDVQAIHTDADTLGCFNRAGDVDFYVGKSFDDLGKDQAGCCGLHDDISTCGPCDHGRSHELVLFSIDHPTHCWAHVICDGTAFWQGCDVPDSCKLVEDATLAHTYPWECNPDINNRMNFGYWWDGSRGAYGVVLTQDTCYECIDDSQCGIDRRCDVIKHECFTPICLGDHDCDAATEVCDQATLKCVPKPASCNGRRKKREAGATCSSEPSEECKAQGGYCGDPAKCPGTVLNNLCPGGQDNKCCTGMPFQEDECAAQGGVCGDRCGCEVDVLHGYCPSQPNSIKCCPQSETTTAAAGPTDEPGACGGAEDCSTLDCSSGDLFISKQY